jgi:hypothetical protein
MWRRRLDDQVTYAQIEQTHNQVEGLFDRLQRAVVRREAGVPPATTSTAGQWW